MSRYDRGYNREYGQRGWGLPLGGMRSDGGWSTPDWKDFPGEEGWYGGGYDRGREGYLEQSSRGERGGAWDRWGPYGIGYGADFRGGYGIDYQNRGYTGRSPFGYPGREQGYGSPWIRGGAQEIRPMAQRSEWGQMRAADIMTSDPESVLPDSPIGEVARKMRDLDIGIIPVIESPENRRLRGIITDRDIAVRAVAEGKTEAAVSECMSGSVRSVNQNDSVQEVMRVMRDEQVRRVPVTDREGRLVGIIAQADLALYYAADNRDREVAFSSTIERISEPAHHGHLAASEAHRQPMHPTSNRISRSEEG